MYFKPHSYQEYAIDKIIELPAVGLFMDMGMGKLREFVMDRQAGLLRSTGSQRVGHD